MKKAILNIKINVPDDFETGACDKCPLHTYRSCEYPGGDWEKVECKFDFNIITCPLEVNKQ